MIKNQQIYIVEGYYNYNIMRFPKKLVKVGSSLGFIIDKKYVDYMGLKKGDYIEAKIKKMIKKK